jgi:cellulose synthase/poly-beta-1,6-N-acetylglucosamine synthase-like glycosyltransferase
MVALISFLLVAIACLFALPIALLFIEVVSAFVLPCRGVLVPPHRSSRPRIAVMVPAYNESVAMLPTLADIKAQLSAGDRLLVVADNCTDSTAAIATAAGAEAVIRNDPMRNGKGYALDWGLRHLDTDPPDIVIIVDADCRLAENAIDRLTAVCTATHRPAQALCLMTAPDQSAIDLRVAEFAWRVKNWVRPSGLRALGLPCHLTGTGMAFPWDLIRSINLASGWIVEDLKMSLDLARTGTFPIFCPSALLISHFPCTDGGVKNQRLRWEYGHIRAIVEIAPRLIFLAITRADIKLLALVLDIAIPPLSLLGMFLIVMLMITGSAALLGASPLSMLVSLANLGGFVSACLICWLKSGRDILPPRSILSICYYVLGKLPLYRKILSRKSTPQWIRTERNRM